VRTRAGAEKAIRANPEVNLPRPPPHSTGELLPRQIAREMRPGLVEILPSGFADFVLQTSPSDFTEC
jgi:hypothetical protein